MRVRRQETLGAQIAKLIPVLTTVLLLLASLIPTHMPGFGAISPMFTVVGVFYWTINRDDLHGPGTAFGIGLLEDLFTGAPLGTNPFVLLMVFWFARSQVGFFRTKPVEISWAGFAVTVLGAALLKWLCYGTLGGGTFVTPVGPIVSALMTAACYPLIARLFGWARLRYLGQDA